MKKKFITLVLMGITLKCLSQVGINTDLPEATLDINGNLRVRKVENCLGDSCADAILIKSNGHFVQYISKEQLFAMNYKSYVSGTGNNGVVLADISALNTWGKILFDKETIDENNDFDTATSMFTAPKDGIYQIYVQYKTSSLISAGELGVGIYIKRGENTPELIAEESYTSVSLLGTTVSPPTRRTQAIVSLKPGDQIYFAAKSPILSLNLVSGTSTFFTIHQIK